VIGRHQSEAIDGSFDLSIFPCEAARPDVIDALIEVRNGIRQIALVTARQSLGAGMEIVLLASGLLFLYARVRLVVEDRRSALGALLAGGSEHLGLDTLAKETGGISVVNTNDFKLTWASGSNGPLDRAEVTVGVVITVGRSWDGRSTIEALRCKAFGAAYHPKTIRRTKLAATPANRPDAGA